MDHRSGVWPCAGFSLIEVLVAIVLLTIGALAAVTMQRTSVKADQLAFTREVAASLAGQLLESIKHLDYESDARIAATAGWTTPDASLIAAAPSFFMRDWMITDEATVAAGNVVRKTIRARVRWNQAGVPQELIVSTIKAW